MELTSLEKDFIDTLQKYELEYKREMISLEKDFINTLQKYELEFHKTLISAYINNDTFLKPDTVILDKKMDLIYICLKNMNTDADIIENFLRTSNSSIYLFYDKNIEKIVVSIIINIEYFKDKLKKLGYNNYHENYELLKHKK